MTVRIEYNGFPEKDLGTEMGALVTAASEVGFKSHMIEGENECGRAVVWDPRWVDHRSVAWEELRFMERYMYSVGFGDKSIAIESGKQYVYVNSEDGRTICVLHTPEKNIIQRAMVSVINPVCNRLNI